MWQRFTERARRVVFFAQEEAQRMNDAHVSTEHLLLGLLKDSDSAALRVLDRLDVNPERIQMEVERAIPTRDPAVQRDLVLTPRAKRVIDLAYDEARNLNNKQIGTEHLLLGLVREGDGLAGRVLARVGVELDHARRAVAEMQGVEQPDKPEKQKQKHRASPASRSWESWQRSVGSVEKAIVGRILLSKRAPEACLALCLSDDDTEIAAILQAVRIEQGRAVADFIAATFVREREYEGEFAVGFTEIMEGATLEASTFGSGSTARAADVLLACLKLCDPSTRRVCEDMGLTYDVAREALVAFRSAR